MLLTLYFYKACFLCYTCTMTIVKKTEYASQPTALKVLHFDMRIKTSNYA